MKDRRSKSIFSVAIYPGFKIFLGGESFSYLLLNYFLELSSGAN